MGWRRWLFPTGIGLAGPVVVAPAVGPLRPVALALHIGPLRTVPLALHIGPLRTVPFTLDVGPLGPVAVTAGVRLRLGINATFARELRQHGSDDCGIEREGVERFDDIAKRADTQPGLHFGLL